MSVKGMMQTVLVTELKQIQPDISDAALQYVINNFSQMFDVREILAEQNEQLQQFCLTAAEVQDLKAEAGRAGFIECATRWNFCNAFGEFVSPEEIEAVANEYAATVRKGGAE